MTLPKSLREKRDVGHAEYATWLDGEPRYQRYVKDAYLDGYDTCYADMLPMVEMFVDGIEDLKVGDPRARRKLYQALSAWREMMEEK